MAPPCSQDTDARFSVFLNPIRDLTKNWEVDIAKYLEEYLEELNEIRITFDGGETTMNFAEAAMLIQGSATVYSKKVEFLWQMVLQMLDLFANRNTTTETTETGKKGSGGKGHCDETIGFISLDTITEGRNIDIREEDDCEEIDDVRKSFKFLPCTPLHLVEKESEKSQYRINIYSKSMELVGAKDDYRINRCYFKVDGTLSLDIPVETLLCNGNIIQDKEEFLPPTRLPDIQEEAAEPPPSPPIEEMNGHLDDDDDDGPGNDDLPPDNVEDPPNIEDEAPPDQPMEVDVPPVQDNEDKSNIIEFPAKYGLRNRSDRDKEKTVVIKLKEPWKPSDPHANTPAKRPIRAGRIRKPLPCSCHAPSARTKRQKSARGEKTESKKQLLPVENFVSSALNAAIDVLPNHSLKMKDVPPTVLEKALKEEADRQSLCKQKKIKDMINENKATSQEEAQEKIAEQAELIEHIDDVLDNDDIVAHHSDDEDVGGTLALPDPHSGNIEHEYGQRPPRQLNTSLCYDAESEYEGLVHKWVNQYIVNAQEYVASSDLAVRVNKWRENITPLLETEEKRTAFDIHGYGSKILSHFPENENSEVITFDKVVEDCDVKEVSRFFLSSLMLANTYNIEISQSEEGDLAMDCTNIKFLSRIRHHEELQEYAAPSQEIGNPSRLTQKRKKGTRRSLIYDEDYQDVNHNHEGPPSPTSSVCSDITGLTHKNNYNKININKQKSDKRHKKSKQSNNR